MDRDQIAARIDRAVRAFGDAKHPKDSDFQINGRVASSVKVTPESIRQWRAGRILPRLESLDKLCEFLEENGVNAAPEFILFGITRGATAMQLRERIAEEGPELDLLRMFRQANKRGRDLILEQALITLRAYPAPEKVISLQQRKKP